MHATLQGRNEPKQALAALIEAQIPMHDLAQFAIGALLGEWAMTEAGRKRLPPRGGDVGGAPHAAALGSAA